MIISISYKHSDDSESTKRIIIPSLIDGQSLQSLAENESIKIGGACGGMGLCTTCRVTILQGYENLPKLSRPEKEFIQRGLLNENQRLACQLVPLTDLHVRIE